MGVISDITTGKYIFKIYAHNVTVYLVLIQSQAAQAPAVR